MTGWRRRSVLTAAALGGFTACSSSLPTPAAPVAPVSSGPTSGGPVPWSRLRRHVDGPIALPGDAAYDVVKLTQDPAYDAARPLGVLSVSSAADVATAIGFATDHRGPLAIRSGGHSYPGWSSGGHPPALVLDCRGLAGVEVHGTSATIGPGTALVAAYDALGRRGRAIAGGSCPTVGVGGLTLGGGVGVLVRAMGLTCDAVTSMQVVTADGRTRTASADSEPDLFWALRGGGGQLGVVTSFTTTTHAAPSLSTVYLQWPLAAAAQVVPAWFDWAPGADPRLWSTLKALGGTSHPDGPILLLSGTWTGPATGSDGFAGQLRGLLDHVPAPAVTSTHRRSYLDAMLSFAGCSTIPTDRCTTGPGGALTRQAFAATSHIAYDPLPAAGVDTLVDRVQSIAGTRLIEAGVSIDALGGRVRDLAPDATAFVHRTALATVQYTATYPTGQHVGPARRTVRSFRAAMTPHWGDHAYVNYADAAVPDPAQAYFGANATRLAQAAVTYDPDGVFATPQPL